MRPQSHVPGAQLSRQKQEVDREMTNECNERLTVTVSDVIAAWVVALGILLALMAWSLL